MHVFGPVNKGENEDIDVEERIEQYWKAANDALFNDERAKNLNLVAAKGQRILCHTWNGAHFLHQNGGFGTFCELTHDEKAALFDADDAGRRAAEMVQ